MAKQLDPAQRMIKGKKRLISKLEQEIKDENAYRDSNIKNIQFRIRQAKVLLDALERGRLKTEAK